MPARLASAARTNFLGNFATIIVLSLVSLAEVRQDLLVHPIHLLCSFGRCEGERCCLDRHVSFPVSNDESVLRCHADCLAGDDILARYRLVADPDPKLPVRVLISEGEMLALITFDHSTSDMLGFDNVSAEGFVNIAN